jgi:hypothetical protein
MPMTETPRIEINGVSPTAVLLRAAAHNNYGHFTAMQSGILSSRARPRASAG